MLEWMKDNSVVQYLSIDFSTKTLADCEQFIRVAENDKNNLHMAIVEYDEYMGTVFLKHISLIDAEFAITIRKTAMGKGIAKCGMHEIIKQGFKELGLERVYWCVDTINTRAIKFYDKNDFERINIQDGLIRWVREIGAYNEQQSKKIYMV